ncbi:hypothetical protein H7X65_01675 [Candidatus Parcubacteria bacterium]|nr:hypothetical protein [Candidatus Parcubacteria bacterium]
MKQDVSKGDPVGTSVSSQSLRIIAPTVGLVAGGRHNMAWTGSAPKKVEKYYIYLSNAAKSKKIFLGTVSSNKNEFFFDVPAATTAGIIEGWKLSILDGEISKKPSLLAESLSLTVKTNGEIPPTTLTFDKLTPNESNTEVQAKYKLALFKEVEPVMFKLTCSAGVSVLIRGVNGTPKNERCNTTIQLSELAKSPTVQASYELNLLVKNTTTTSGSITVDGLAGKKSFSKITTQIPTTKK